MFQIDTHAHVISLEQPMVPSRRHTPNEASLESYIKLHDESGISNGVLIQPSVYGTDNSYMCECIKKMAGRIRGIVAIDPSFDDAVLDKLEKNYIVGVRFSLLDMPVNTLGKPEWQNLIKRLAKRKWVIEALIKSPDVKEFFYHVAPTGCRIIINHFSIPDINLGINDEGFQALLKESENRNVWVKISGAYRCGGLKASKPLADKLVSTYGPGRLLWGSDWPWTQFQNQGFTYPMMLDWLNILIKNKVMQKQILGKTAAKIYGFN